MTKKPESKEAFARRFAEAVMPSEFNDYKAYLHNYFWSLEIKGRSHD